MAKFRWKQSVNEWNHQWLRYYSFAVAPCTALIVSHLFHYQLASYQPIHNAILAIVDILSFGFVFSYTLTLISIVDSKFVQYLPVMGDLTLNFRGGVIPVTVVSSFSFVYFIASFSFGINDSSPLMNIFLSTIGNLISFCACIVLIIIRNRIYE